MDVTTESERRTENGAADRAWEAYADAGAAREHARRRWEIARRLERNAYASVMRAEAREELAFSRWSSDARLAGWARGYAFRRFEDAERIAAGAAS